MKTLRYGIIGTGNIAHSTHIPRIQNMEATQILAVRNDGAEGLRRGVKSTGAPMAVRDYRERRQVDAPAEPLPIQGHDRLIRILVDSRAWVPWAAKRSAATTLDVIRGCSRRSQPTAPMF